MMLLLRSSVPGVSIFSDDNPERDIVSTNNNPQRFLVQEKA